VEKSVSHIAPYIDHTILKPTTTLSAARTVCNEALTYGFAAVCIPPPLVRQAKVWLHGDENGGASGAMLAAIDTHPAADGTTASRPPVKVATVIGFPFGYSACRAKKMEAEQALSDGADELDVVINLMALKNGDTHTLEREMLSITEAAHAKGKIVKVIIESGILSDEEIIRCCTIYSKIGVDFLKTSTGYAERGATVEAVRLMRQNLPSHIRIKASGGIRTLDFARELIAAGADRLGCSASVEIVKAELS
jgi:deoxyribose-phosphate aldolase